MTNGDKIRLMDDEELATMLMYPESIIMDKVKTMSDKNLAEVIRCPYKKCMCLLDEAGMTIGGTPLTEENCRKCAERWLAAEAADRI